MMPDERSHESPAAQDGLAQEILDRLDALLLGAERETKPLELDPYRSSLFELFVTAEGAGYVDENAQPDLTCDGIARALALRWNLADATRMSVAQQTRLPPEHLARMRLLWSLMRMWMEWTYAWQRWTEFHHSSDDADAPVPPE